MADQIVANRTSSFLTPDDLAIRYRIPKPTAAKWRWNGSGPTFVKLGSRVLYREADVESWISANERTSTAANG
jgi:hypothetical protein